MTQIAVQDQVASDLAVSAASRGCSQEDLASMLIREGLQREDDFQLTTEQEASLLESIEQAKRGEFVDGEIVMARFAAALEAMETR